jgi:hypothetical protein
MGIVTRAAIFVVRMREADSAKRGTAVRVPAFAGKE